MRAVSAPSQELIFLDPDDDLATVRAKLESSLADEIYLVVPNNAGILRTPLEFRILGRLAGELSSETIIVSGDGHRRFLAHQEGFRTKSSVRQLRHLMRPSHARAGAAALLDWLPVPSARTGFLALALVVTLVVFSSIVLPEMRVIISPRADAVSQSYEVTVDPSAVKPDLSRRVLPGRKLEQRLETRGSVPTSGSGTVGRTKALGEIQLVSQRSDEVRIPRGTVVTTSDGVRFTVESEVVVPPRGRPPVRASIAAVEAGSRGNVAPRAINRFEDSQAFVGIQVLNLVGTTGGADRQAQVVAEQDVAGLRDQLLQQAREEGAVVLQGQAGPDWTVLKEAIRVTVVEERLEQEVGAASERLSGRLSATVSALAFRREELARLLMPFMLPQPEGQYQMVGGQPRLVSFQVIEVGPQSLKVRVRAEGVVVRAIDTAAIEASLRGASIDEARAILARVPGLAGQPRLEVWPAWSPRAYRVSVEVAAPR